ncbi:MAG: hypothetical protein AB7F28_01440 [Candidatus Margulisiibacteriota bacterium]
MGNRFLALLKQNSLAAYGFFTALVFGVYGAFLGGGYFLDDDILIHHTLQDALFSPLGNYHFRPLWGLSIYLTNLVVHNPVLDRFWNYLLLGGFLLLVFRFWDRVLANTQTALMGTLFILILPTIPYHAVWISGRQDLLMGIFFLAAFHYFELKRPGPGVVYLMLALLSKVTVLLSPLYFIGSLFRQGQRRLAWVLSGGFLGVAGLSLLKLGQHHVAQTHLLHLPLMLRLANMAAHVGEFCLTLIFPIPFFSSVWHGALYVLGLCLILGSVRLDWSKGRPDFLILFILISATTVVTPELRIATLNILFLLAYVLTCPRTIRHPRVLKVGLGLVFAALLIATLTVSKLLIQNTNRDPSKPYQGSGALYANGYYGEKRTLLIGLKNRFW